MDTERCTRCRNPIDPIKALEKHKKQEQDLKQMAAAEPADEILADLHELAQMRLKWASESLEPGHTGESRRLEREMGSVCLECLNHILEKQQNLQDRFKRHPEPNQQVELSDGSFSPILYQACQYPWAQDDFIREILAAGALIHKHQDLLSNPVFAATQADWPPALALLHEYGACLNLKVPYPHNRTPLHLAVDKGCLKALAWLTVHGAGLDAADINGRTALHLAAGGKSPQALEMLLDSGATINPLDNNGLSPMRSAAKKARPDNLAVLLSRGAADSLDSSQWDNLLGMAEHMLNYAWEDYQTTKSWNPKRAESYCLPLMKKRQAVLDLLLQRRALV